MRSVLFVGMAPNRSGEGAGRALTGAHTRARLENYAGGPLLDLVDTVNLLNEWPGSAGGTKWDRVDAPGRELDLAGRALVVGLGGYVRRELCRQLGVREPAWFLRQRIGADGTVLAFSPHPAGTSTWWNDPEHRARGSSFWRGVRSYALEASRLQAAQTAMVRGDTEWQT